MGAVELIQCANARGLAAEVARRWVEELRAWPMGRLYGAGLSGGRIARPLFEEVALECRRKGLPPQQVHFFWADERCVPPGDEESNFKHAEQYLFRPLGVKSEQIHRVRGELEPEAAAREAEAALRLFAPINRMGQPILNMIFLGLGEDGHVASLFPEEPEEVRSQKAIYRAVQATKPPPQRVTMGYGVLGAAEKVWVLASGAGKEGSLRESLQADSKLPLGRVLQMRTKTVIFSDFGVG